MKYGDFLNIMSSFEKDRSPTVRCKKPEGVEMNRAIFRNLTIGCIKNIDTFFDVMHFTLCQFHSRYNSLLSLSNVKISRMDRNIIHKNEIVGILYQITFKFTLYTLYTRLSWILDWVSMQVLVLGYMRRTWAFLTHNGI